MAYFKDIARPRTRNLGQISGFKGVDYNNSVLNVSDNRAINMVNYIHKNGVTQKRHGFHQVFSIEGYNETTKTDDWYFVGGKINNIQSFFGYNNETHILVHAGKKIYRISKFVTNPLFIANYYFVKVVDTEGNEKEEAILINNKNYDEALKYWEETNDEYAIFYELAIPYKTKGRIKDAPSTMFFDSNNAYILCGDYLVYKRVVKDDEEYYVLNRVEDDDETYIPTTTQLVTCDDSPTPSRFAGDEVNLLSKYRKNTFIGETEGSSLTNFRFRLDTELEFEKIDASTAKTDIKFKIIFSQLVDSNYRLTERTIDLSDKVFTKKGSSNEGYYETEFPVGLMTPLRSNEEAFNGGNERPVPNALFWNIKSGSYQLTEINYSFYWDKLFLRIIPKDNGQSVFYFVKQEVKLENGIPTGYSTNYIEINPYPPIENEANIEVTFKSEVEGNADKINNCSFGVQFGTTGNKNRLFLTGNPDYPNLDFRSSDILSSDSKSYLYANYTYFADLDYCAYGSKNTAVTGYLMLSDGSLGVFKELSSYEPNFYIRTAEFKQAISYDGKELLDANGNNLYEETYPVKIGQISEGCINNKSLLNLAGDNLFLSKNGLYSIQITENISIEERQARERSRYVNNELLKYDLSKAVCTIWDNKYLIGLEDKIFVADARFKSQLEDDFSDTFQYEWFIWNGITATSFYVDKQNNLYIGTDKGKIFVYSNDSYQDISYEILKEGEITNVETDDAIKERGSQFLVNNKYRDVIENLDLTKDKIFLKANYHIYDSSNLNLIKSIEPKLAVFIGYLAPRLEDIKDNYISYDLSNYPIFTTGADIYIFDETGVFEFGVPYKFEFVDNDSSRFKICKKGEEEAVDLSNLKTGLFCYYRESLFEFSNVNSTENECSFYIKDRTGSQVTIAASGKFPSVRLLQATIIKARNVSCFYLTKPFDFGTSMFRKNLISLTITNDTKIGSSIQFGFDTKKDKKLFNYNTDGEFNFTNFDLNNVDFYSDVTAESFTKNYVCRGFNFIQFVFKSDSDKNCIVPNITVLYNIGNKNRGVN